MTIRERHEQIDDMTITFRNLHEQHFPSKSMTDEDWDKCISDFQTYADKYKNTNLEDLAGELCIAYLNDIERVHKAWRKKEGA